MIGDDSPAAVVERRTETLRALAVASASKAELAERIGVSRSTAERSLRDLSMLGFVAATADGYQLTVPGRLALDEHDRRIERIGRFADVASLFDGIEVGIDVDPALFDDARVVEPRPHAPHRPVECVAALVADATHVSVYSARHLSRNARVYHNQVLDGMTGTFVVTDRVVDQQRSTRPGDLREALDLGRIDIRRTDRDEPVTLVLAETPDGPEVGLVLYLDGTPRGFVGTDDPAATRWARDLHERLWQSATPL
ncbi:helix-turn-helix transcriptional regulator [Haloplanus aerogenes]|uniref:ArsR family transcriptional regulator n=1 Tax=Haloplanus aerogenes TaxID=660522 RepID=A0A3M0CTI8_9EURY|nr:winged helix-turn-helix domain-containing protein [Haloplanus aerogenes]AZH26590.1 ArsR family transcriptional regulator [Haloplanus aerogenes]RMB12821.1 putative transcriptional regulator [Haloplanus aerogenes]